MGAIVCISSIAGMRYIGKPQIAYNTAKAAILQFVKATAVMYADRNIRVNTVVPGLMDTPYTKSLAERYGKDYQELRDGREQQVPMGRMGDAWDVANAALFWLVTRANMLLGRRS